MHTVTTLLCYFRSLLRKDETTAIWSCLNVLVTFPWCISGVSYLEDDIKFAWKTLMWKRNIFFWQSDNPEISQLVLRMKWFQNFVWWSLLCIVLNTGTFCVCVRLYLDIDECAEMFAAGGPPCDPDAVCINTPGSYRCSEPSGVSCKDVDPATGQCLNVGPGFCQPGTRFDSAAGQCVGETKSV